MLLRRVPAGSPEEEAALVDEERAVLVVRDHHASRKARQPVAIRALRPTGAETFGVQDTIHVVGRGPRGARQVGVGGGPVLTKELVSGSLALGAGAVASGERGSLVEEEQLGVAAG